MLLRLSTLATGRTGVRAETAQAYATMLNAGITPVVHEYGSLGCSGDLAPLAHCALAMMGEGPVRDADGTLRDAADVVEHPITLQEKEGLALINGTDGMLGMLVLALHDLRTLLTTADIAAAMSVEGLLGTDRVFAGDLHAAAARSTGRRCRRATSARCSTAARSSPATAARRTRRVQDAYSLRCAPQVAGAARDTPRTPRRSPSASWPPRSTTP